MSVIDAGPWIIASACMTLAVVHFRIWLNDRAARGQLGFCVVAVGVALFGLCELGLMRAETIERYARVLRLTHVPIFMMVVGIVVFIREHFGTGRPWLARASWAINAATLVVTIAFLPHGDFTRITTIDRVSYLGDTVSIARGDVSAWHWIGQAGFLVLAFFVVDAALPLWRSGDRRLMRRAVLVGGSLVLFVVFAAGEAALLFAGLVRLPHMGAPAFFPVLLAMGFELSDDVLRASRLSVDLQASQASLRESEARMRLAAAEAQELSGRLINAQEDERRRIARDLHDDLSQRLGVMSLQLDMLRQSPGMAPADAQIDRLAGDIRGVATEIHALSHRLHPAKLDQLGLATAARAWCRDLSSQSCLSMAFKAETLPATMAADTALCLYRILQETTRNIVRHSGASSATVTLGLAGTDLRLVVDDNGHGFDVERARRSGGLGLVSMHERVRSLDGTLTIESAPGRGTRVEANVPLATHAST
jgi:signal transduction histidine kinase